jgi:hypothetical protein
LLAIVSLALLLYIPGQVARQDARTWGKAQDAANEINSYVLARQVLPADLKAINFTPDDDNKVTYRKISDTAYEFCVQYRRAGVVSYSGSEYTGGPSIMDTVDNLLYDPGGSYDGDIAYTDTKLLYVPRKHKAGANCQTIKPELKQQQSVAASKPQPLSQAANGHTLVCKVEVSRYLARGPILKFNPQQVYLNNSQTKTAVMFIDVNYSQIPGDAGSTTYMHKDDSLIFDQNCKQLNLVNLKIGDMVQVYSVISADKGAVDIFLKE